MLDLVLAITHHLLAFALLGILCFQLATLHRLPDANALQMLARVDIFYGFSAAAVLAVGFARATLAAKGWEFYLHNGAFWAKVAVFVLIGLISIRPTLALRRWRQQTPENIPGSEISSAKCAMILQLVLFPLLPLFAAAMARGVAQF